MKKIQKKWMLFTMASVVSFLGISHSLLKGTDALETTEEPNDVVMNDYQYVYTLDKKGDITLDGVLDRLDIMIISNHIIGSDIITSEDILETADYDDNNKIDINDIVKMYVELESSGGIDE